MWGGEEFWYLRSMDMGKSLVSFWIWWISWHLHSGQVVCCSELGTVAGLGGTWNRLFACARSNCSICCLIFAMRSGYWCESIALEDEGGNGQGLFHSCTTIWNSRICIVLCSVWSCMPCFVTAIFSLILILLSELSVVPASLANLLLKHTQIGKWQSFLGM